MERSNLAFQSLPDSYVMIGGNGGLHGEKPSSVLIINVAAVPVNHEYGEQIGEPVDLQLALTVPQMATIAWNFFGETLIDGVYRKFYKRLLEKRWAVMTDPSYKTEPPHDPEGYRGMQYFHLA